MNAHSQVKERTLTHLEQLEAENLLKDVPTIILTASSDPETKARALELGATEFITKPVDPSELVLRLRNTLAARAYWSGCWDAPAARPERVS